MGCSSYFLYKKISGLDELLAFTWLYWSTILYKYDCCYKLHCIASGYHISASFQYIVNKDINWPFLRGCVLCEQMIAVRTDDCCSCNLYIIIFSIILDKETPSATQESEVGTTIDKSGAQKSSSAPNNMNRIAGPTSTTVASTSSITFLTAPITVRTSSRVRKPKKRLDWRVVSYEILTSSSFYMMMLVMLVIHLWVFHLYRVVFSKAHCIFSFIINWCFITLSVRVEMSIKPSLFCVLVTSSPLRSKLCCRSPKSRTRT